MDQEYLERGSQFHSTPFQISRSDNAVDYVIIGGGPAGRVLAEQLS